MIRRPPRSTQSRSSAASDVYKRQLTAGPFPSLRVLAGLVRRVGVDPLELDDHVTARLERAAIPDHYAVKARRLEFWIRFLYGLRRERGCLVPVGRARRIVL